MVPEWLHILSIVLLAGAFAIAAWVAVDVVRRPPPMWIMQIVWPVTMLFGSVVTLAFYLAHGRGTPAGADDGSDDDGSGGNDSNEDGSEDDSKDEGSGQDAPTIASVAKGTLHCGAGCTLGDIVAEWLMVAFPVIAFWFGLGTLFGERIFAAWIFDYVLAFGFGILFQYFSIVPMRDLSPGEGLVAAVKADTLSLTAWQVGMYGFMAFAHFYIFDQLIGAPLEVPTVEFWFMMQIAMIAGFLTAYPANRWLIGRGIKEEM